MKRKILRLVVGIVALLTVQMLTFLYVAPGLLEEELLPASLTSRLSVTDKAYIRDYYITDCYVGEEHLERLSHHLADREDIWKRKLKTNKIFFESRGRFHWGDTSRRAYPVIYDTWMTRNKELPMGGLFMMYQTECLIVNEVAYFREVRYFWCFFVWIKAKENLDEMPRENYVLL